MGHERVGALPKTKPWEKVVKNIAAFDSTAEHSRKIANQTLDNVRNKFESIQRDPNVREAFRFLTELAVSGAKGNWASLQLPENPTPFAVAKALDKAISGQSGSSEYAAIA